MGALSFGAACGGVDNGTSESGNTSSFNSQTQSSSSQSASDDSSSNDEQEKQPSEGLEYTLSDDGTYYSVTDIGTCTDIDVIISSTYKNLPVKEIDEWAFADCADLTKIIIPDSVTSIGDGAFSYCSGLTSITFKGTIAQWNAITKYGYWYYRVPAKKVVCSDGTVKL